jgi:hypothetical protein
MPSRVERGHLEDTLNDEQQDNSGVDDETLNGPLLRRGTVVVFRAVTVAGQTAEPASTIAPIGSSDATLPLGKRCAQPGVSAYMTNKARPRNLSLLTEDELLARREVLLAGIDQYNEGYFFEAHETWEELWIVSPWPARRFLQGLIQVAAGFVHLMRHEYPGTVRLLGHALEKLDGFRPQYLGIDVEKLATDVRRARNELLALGPERFEEWDKGRIPRIHLALETDPPPSTSQRGGL